MHVCVHLSVCVIYNAVQSFRHETQLSSFDIY